MVPYQRWIETAEAAARKAGLLLRRMQRQITAREKAPKDLVSEADLAAQRTLRQALLDPFPEYGFLGEEEPQLLERLSEFDYCWVVDPLDGTSNYVHGVPSYAISIALWHANAPLIGIVWDPILQECYRAVRGKGATLNGKPIHPSGCRRLREALVAASLAPQVARGSVEVARLVEAIYEAQAVRRTGSAALNLCYVAAGRFDGYWATSVRLWDVAAGLLLVEEAGGVATGLQGEPFDWQRPEVLVAATVELHAELMEMLRRADRAGGRGS